MTVEWTTGSIHCGLQPGVLVADSSYMFMSSFWKNMYKMKLFSFKFSSPPSSQVCSIAYLKSDDQIMYIATNYFQSGCVNVV